MEFSKKAINVILEFLLIHYEYYHDYDSEEPTILAWFIKNILEISFLNSENVIKVLIEFLAKGFEDMIKDDSGEHDIEMVVFGRYEDKYSKLIKLLLESPIPMELKEIYRSKIEGITFY